MGLSRSEIHDSPLQRLPPAVDEREGGGNFWRVWKHLTNFLMNSQECLLTKIDAVLFFLPQAGAPHGFGQLQPR